MGEREEKMRVLFVAGLDSANYPMVNLIKYFLKKEIDVKIYITKYEHEHRYMLDEFSELFINDGFILSEFSSIDIVFIGVASDFEVINFLKSQNVFMASLFFHGVPKSML